MSAYLFTELFYLLLLLLMCCTLLCGHVCVNGVEAPKTANNVVLFDKTKINDAQKPNGDQGAKETDVKDYHSPVLVSTNKILFALAGVNRTSKNEKRITVLTRYASTEGENDLEGKLFTPSSSEGGGWKSQFAVYDECKVSDDCVTDDSIVRGLAAAVKGDKIYLFLANISTKAQSTGPCDGLNWCFWLIVGDATEKGGGKPIKWGEKEEKLELTGNVEQINNNIFKKELSKSHLIDSTAFVMSNTKILFVVKGLLEKGVSDGADENKKVAAVFLHEEGGKQLKLVDVEKTKDSYPTFFQWNEQIFKILPGKPPEGKDKIMVLNDNEEQSFEETKNPISRFYYFLKGKQNFATANFEDKGTVLLFTQQRKAAGSNNNVYLWMTDGTRVSCTGTIVENIGSTDAFYVSLLYTKTKLLALHQTVKTADASEENNKVEFTLLQKHLGNITNTLDAWTKSNNKIKNLYKNTATPITDINFADGIVGFLSSTKDSITWEDGYLYANAVITSNENQGNATKEKNDGFTFAGTGAGAKWPVGKDENDQPYNFIDSGFTLLATVTVGSVKSNNDNSILGVGITGNTNTVGLWCAASGKWGVKVGNGKEVPSTEINCKGNEKYYVAFILNGSKKVLVYVDGQQLTELDDGKITIDSSKNIAYFYFGADTLQPTQNTDVTITNVLLYNRPFTKDEIKQLKSTKNNVADAEQTTRPENGETVRYDDSTKQNDSSHLNTSPTENDKKEAAQSSSLPPTTEDGAVRVGVVGVLFFMLFGVFTLLGRYVY